MRKTIAYKQGREAALDEARTGITMINPYPPSSKNFDDWERGYSDEYEIDD